MTAELALNDLGCYLSFKTVTMAVMAVIKISSEYKMAPELLPEIILYSTKIPFETASCQRTTVPEHRSHRRHRGYFGLP